MALTNKITQLQHDAIERAVINAANATSKSAATRYLNQAREIRAALDGVIDDYSDDKLGSAISRADDAFKCSDQKMKKKLIDDARHYLYAYTIGLNIA